MRDIAILTLWAIFPLSWILFFISWSKRQRVLDRLEEFLDSDDRQKAWTRDYLKLFEDKQG